MLEALYVAATTRSFRTAQMGDCLAHELASRNDAAMRVEVEVENPGRVRLEVGFNPAVGPWRRLNGKRQPLSEHLAQLPVLAWTAGDGEVLLGGPGPRRRFLDRGIVGREPRALETLARYRRILDHKRQLLAQRHGGLEAWNAMLAEAAVAVVKRRAALVKALGVALDEIIATAGLALSPVELVYEPSPPETEIGNEQTAAALERLEGAERERRRPLAGPHRDRLHIRMGGREAERVASAGERKALGLALAAAQAEVWRQAGRQPVLLLDDADAELDRPTLARLWRIFAGEARAAAQEGLQTMVTSNRPEAWETLSVDHRWSLERGVFRAL